MDAVQSSRFITRHKSEQLIRKLEQLTSRHQAKQLQRSVYVWGRAKTTNERPILHHPYPLHPVHPEVGDAVLGVMADKVVVILPPGEGVGADQILPAAPPEHLLPVRPVAEVPEALRECGMDVVSARQGSSTVYFVGEREFQLPELKLLVDRSPLPPAGSRPVPPPPPVRPWPPAG